jgi:ribosomal protein L35
MKLKTNKTVAKRVKFSGAKKGSRFGGENKLIRKKAGQGHFNSREPGKVTRKKRSDEKIIAKDEKNIRRLLPYS